MFVADEYHATNRWPSDVMSMSNILIFAEHQAGKIKKTTIELISKATELAGGGKIGALVVGSNVESLASELGSLGVHNVFVAQDSKLEKYNTLATCQALAEAIKTFGAHIVLGSASPIGKDIFPRVSARLKAGLASDSVDLRIDGGKLVARRPIYSGKAFVDVTFNTDVQMATSRANSFPVNPASAVTPEVTQLNLSLGDLRAPMKELAQGEVGKVDLTEAEIIVSGGRAMANADNFKILKELADVIHASVGASRAAVDSGFAPHDMQVGQTGKVVNPKLYIACGISGAIQHLAGMRTSKVIVAINKDPEAPLFQKADYAVVGDLFTFVPLLTQELKKIVSE